MPPENLKLFRKPTFNKKPYFVAGWPGMANVALTVVTYLKEKLQATPLGELTSPEYFAPTNAIVSDQVILPPARPNNQFYYYSSPGSKKDILLFIGSEQPVPHREYEFAMEILRIAKMWEVSLVFTAAAAPSDMNYFDTPRVFAVPNDKELLNRLMEYKVHFMGEGHIAGLNGLLISAARVMNLDGICLLGEIPFFTAQLEFPRAALQILKILVQLLGIEVDLLDLELYAEKKDKEIAPIANLLSKGSLSASEKEFSEEVAEDPKKEKEKTIPPSVRTKIERLFHEAEAEGSYKAKMRLKEELDRWGLFEEYQDRFLDLFRKS